MIMLLNEAFQSIKVVNTDEQLFHYLKAWESFKNLDSRERQNWAFNRYPPSVLADFVKEMEQNSFVHMAWKAYQQEKDMIVMCTGDAENPSLFIVTPGSDVASLQNEWCKRYCQAHKLYILTR